MHHQALQRQLAQQGCHTQQPQKSEQRHNKTTYSVNSRSTSKFKCSTISIWLLKFVKFEPPSSDTSDSDSDTSDSNGDTSDGNCDQNDSDASDNW